MRTAELRRRILDGEVLASTFVKTPEVTVIKVLATSGLDFIVLDADPFKVDPGSIWSIGVEQTWLGGERVFSSDEDAGGAFDLDREDTQ